MRTKYDRALNRLLLKPAFTVKEAMGLGVPRHALAYYEQIGLLKKLGKGIYSCAESISHIEPQLEELARVALSIPESVICLISALSYYGLTDEIPRECWIALPHAKRAPKRPHTRIIRMRTISIGVTKVEIGGLELSIFNRERCVIDAFRYLSLEIAIKALKSYLHEKKIKPDLRKLKDYSKKLRVNISPYVLSLLE
ncbi:MAG: type IV toxin-antitoxin system AbiEi family antitoxin domain-containing protein [Chlamydiia bacterium]|nr:type IV toxin-antitoxin system AbiEi family antitoxin domain-containing protein [Chlamydiia bacterium]MCP5505946.1 type IV toxin-antitoxin system AbiEi family antitoxin domain-containing protein [Chlamydiales bacterium]